MAKKVYVGDGKWCYTENCAIHSPNSRSIHPRSEKSSLALKQSSLQKLQAMPNIQEVFKMGEDKMREYDQARLHYDDALMHLAISPKGRKALREKVFGNNTSEKEKEKLIPLYEDSSKLLEAYSRVKTRYFYGSNYATENGEQVQAIPLSLDNISEVNEWVDGFYKVDPAWNQGTNEDVETQNEQYNHSEDENFDKKTKTKIFRKKNKLWYQNHEGQNVELTESSYLLREKGKEGFALVSAKTFEGEYTSLLEQRSEPLLLNQAKRERFFPSKNLSEFISVVG